MAIRSPQGLLSLFDLKTEGKNPPFLLDTIVPGFDALPFYTAGITEKEGRLYVAVTFAGPDSVTPAATVPDNEMWLVLAASAVSSFSPVDQAHIVPIILDANLNYFPLVGQNTPPRGATSQGGFSTWHGLAIAHPGDRLTSWSSFAFNASAFVNFQVVKLTI